MRINRGYIDNNEYRKLVNFSKAVLWMTREISLPKDIMQTIMYSDIPTIRFIDPKKREEWVFKTSKVIKNMRLKQVGQEAQYYFSIALAKVIKQGEGGEIKHAE